MEYPERNLPAFDVETIADTFSDFGSLFECNYRVNDFEHEVSSCRPDNIRLVNEEISSGIEDVHPNIQRLMEQVQNLSRCSEATHLGLSSDSGTSGGTGLLSIGRYVGEPLSNISPRGRDSDLRIGEQCPSNRLNEERMENIATQLLLLNVENDPGGENLDIVNNLSQNDISVEYWQLYLRSPSNYDFAMDIMAYIELLNDSSWKTTVSYLDVNVKRMLKDIWMEKHVLFYNAIDLQTFNREMVLHLMLDFTKWSIDRDFYIEEFLNYCVLICQLAVVARKQIFKEAPLYVIGQLRNRFKFLKFENLVQFMIQRVVKDYAQRLFGNVKM